jgi:hypothetical protein
MIKVWAWGGMVGVKRCVCVCVCVREKKLNREREKEQKIKKSEREREGMREREREKTTKESERAPYWSANARRCFWGEWVIEKRPSLPLSLSLLHFCSSDQSSDKKQSSKSDETAVGANTS